MKLIIKKQINKWIKIAVSYCSVLFTEKYNNVIFLPDL